MSWVGLRYKGVEPLFPEEWNAVIDALDWLYAYFVDIRTKTLNKDVLQHIDVNIIPAEDRRYDLGAPDRRWEEVHAFLGYFDGDLFVQGRRVIKDEDPIYIAAFIDQAKTDVDSIKSSLSSIASNTATTATNTGDIKTQLTTISGKLDTTNTKLGNIESKVTNIDGKLGDVLVSLSEIAADIDLLVVYARYIDVKLAVIKARVESIDATAKSIDATAKSIEGKVDAVVASLSEIDDKLADIRSYTRSLLDIYAKVTEVSGKIDTTNARLSESVAILSEIDARVASIREYVRYTPDIYAKLVEANARLEEANAKLAGMQVLLSEIESTVATIESYTRDLPAIRARTESIDAKLDTTNAKLSEIDTTTKSIDSKLGETLVSLSEIDAKLADIKDYVKYVADKVASIEAETASIEVHVSDIDAKLDTTNTKLGNIEAKVSSIDSKFDTQLSTRASEDTLKKCCAFDYDFAIRRTGGRLLSTVDFTLNQIEFGISETDLRLVIVEGASSYRIVRWSDEGIPMPEGTGSPYVLKIIVPAGGTAYVRVPVKARYFKPFSAYITVYNRDYDMEYNFYISLGGYYQTSVRNKLPRRLRLPANRWGRFIVHWFMEAHHGCAEVDVEIYNPNSVDVTVYVGIMTAGEIEPHIQGHGLLFGWEGDFEIPVSDETLTFNISVFLPPNAGEVVSMGIGYGIVGDGTNPLNIDVKILYGGVSIVTDSNSSTTAKYGWRDFKVVTAKRGLYGLEFLPLQVTLSTAGSGKLVSFNIVVRAFAREYRYQKYIEATVAGGATNTLIDLTNDTKHIVGAQMEVTAPADGDVNILADTPEGEIVVCKVPAGSTEKITVDGRYTYLKVQNTGTGNATVRATVVISDAYLPR